MIKSLITGKRTTAQKIAAEIIHYELQDILYWERWETEEMTPKDKDKIMAELNAYIRRIDERLDVF